MADHSKLERQKNTLLAAFRWGGRARAGREAAAKWALAGRRLHACKREWAQRASAKNSWLGWNHEGFSAHACSATWPISQVARLPTGCRPSDTQLYLEQEAAATHRRASAPERALGSGALPVLHRGGVHADAGGWPVTAVSAVVRAAVPSTPAGVTAVAGVCAGAVLGLVMAVIGHGRVRYHVLGVPLSSTVSPVICCRKVYAPND